MVVEHIRVLAGRTYCSPEPWFNFKPHWPGWVIVTMLRSEPDAQCVQGRGEEEEENDSPGESI